MFEVISTTEIAAPAERVWSVLTDLRQFASWNPFIRRAHGDTGVGGTVHVRVRSSFGLPLKFAATILERDDNHELRWRGHVLAPWLASGDHTFTIEPIGDGRVRFVQRETFGGILPRLASKLLRREAKAGFDAMNHALGMRSEAPPPGGPS